MADESITILDSIKKLLGAESMDAFDENLLMFINGALNVLTQNGVGDPKGFSIKDGTETWEDFITNDHIELYELCKEFVYLKVRLVFDPPTGSVLDYYQKQIQEDLWRIREQAEPADIFEVNKED